MIEDKLDELLELPPRQWQYFISKLTPKELRELEKLLNARAEFLCRLAGYVAERGLHAQGVDAEPIGDQDDVHTKAVKRANKCVAAYRKANGFTLPHANDCTF